MEELKGELTHMKQNQLSSETETIQLREETTRQMKELHEELQRIKEIRPDRGLEEMLSNIQQQMPTKAKCQIGKSPPRL
jgi:hypothetical protein